MHNMKNHEVLNIDGSIIVRRVPGGWIYLIHYGQDLRPVFVPYSSEFAPKKEKKKDNELDSRIEYDKLLNLWNSKKIIKCIKLTPNLVKVINKRVKSYDTIDEGKRKVAEAIKNYSLVYHDKQYFFNQAWSLEKFLSQGNAMIEFLNDGVKWINYNNETQPLSETKGGFKNLKK